MSYNRKSKLLGKTLALMLAASLITSAYSLGASAAYDDDYYEDDGYYDEDFNLADHTLGVTGGFNDWGGDYSDYVMTDADGDGIYTVSISNLEAGYYEYKVRADEEWDYSWGEYEDYREGTFGSQTNCSITIEDGDVLNVSIDTNGNMNNWTVVGTVEGVTRGVTDDGFSYLEREDSVTINGYNGTSLNVTVPSTIHNKPVTVVSATTFRYSNVRSVVWPASATAIPSYAFNNCEHLESVTLPSALESIGYSAFSDCSALTAIKLPDTVEDIGTYAFSGCSALASVNISKGMTEISEGTFLGCSSLKTISILGNIEYVDDDAFYGCTSLQTVNIGKGLSSLSSSALNECPSLSAIYVNTANSYYASSGGILFNKDKTELIRYPVAKSGTEYAIPNTVTKIRSSAFRGNQNLTSVTIPGSVKEIGYSAFYGCTALQTMTIPASVTWLGGYAFSGCTALTSVTIGKGVPSIEYDTFYGCTALTSVTIGKGVTSIGDNAFDSCTSLTSFTLPDNVKEVDYAPFANCTSLKSFSTGNGLTNLPESMFSGCEALETVALGDNVKTIDGGAFYDCNARSGFTVSSNNSYFSAVDGVLFNKNKTALVSYPKGKTATKYTVPSTVVELYANAFNHCNNLTTVVVPDNVKKIGGYAFSNCYQLKTAKLPKQVDDMGDGVFRYCEALTSVTLPENLTSIPDYTFVNCSALKTVSLPASLKSIGECAFGSCSCLEQIILPDGVESISSESFEYCGRLNMIVIPQSVTSIGGWSFYDCYALVIYGVSGSYAEEYADNCGYRFEEYEALENFTFAYSDKVVLGETVKLRGLSEGGIGKKQYAFYYKKTSDTAWKTISGFSTTKTVSFTPDKVGTYDVCVKVQDSLGTVAKKYLTIEVYSTLENTSTVSKNIVDVNAAVTLKGSATGGTGYYQYAYYWKKASDSSWKTISGMTSVTSKTFKASEAGLYDICIKVQDSLGTVTKKYLTVNVGGVFANVSTVSSNEIKLGESVTVNAAAQGGSGSYQYAVFYKKTSDSSWTTKQAYSANSTVTIKPGKATTYDICVKAKDSENHEAKTYFTVTVKTA